MDPLLRLVKKGEFSDNLINGKGKYVWKTLKSYEGEWMNNKMHGIGLMRWPDGKVYEGEFRNDKKWGKGKLTTPDGKVYEGEWEEGHMKKFPKNGENKKLKNVKSSSKESNSIKVK